jgi:hypothetical protein
MAKVLSKEEQIINQHIDDLRERMTMLGELICKTLVVMCLVLLIV